jgi:hypothetical protein
MYNRIFRAPHNQKTVKQVHKKSAQEKQLRQKKVRSSNLLGTPFLFTGFHVSLLCE